MTLKWRFMISPIISLIILMLLVSIIYMDIRNKDKRIHELITREIESSLFFTSQANKLAINHSDLYDLFRQSQIINDEGAIYEKGKELLLNIRNVEDTVRNNPYISRENTVEKKWQDQLLHYLSKYQIETTNAVIMAGIDPSRAFLEMNNSQQQFNNLNQYFLSLNQKLELLFEERVENEKNNFLNQSQSVLCISSILMIFVFSFSYILSCLLSRQFKKVVSTLLHTAEKTHPDIIPLNKHQEKDELKILLQIAKLIETTQLELNDYKDNLEKKIEDRTQDLKKSYRYLKDYNEKLNIAKLEAVKINREKSEFLTMISHDIRTPMNGVLGMMELLKHTQLNNEQKEYVNVITSSGKALIKAVNDMVEFSNLESPFTSFEMEPFHLKDVVNEVFTPYLLEDSLTVELEQAIDSNIPDILIGDSILLHQILAYLIDLIIKNTLKGSILLKVELTYTREESANIMFSLQAPTCHIDIPISKNHDELSHQGLKICSEWLKKLNGVMNISNHNESGLSLSFTVEFSILDFEKKPETHLKSINTTPYSLPNPVHAPY